MQLIKPKILIGDDHGIIRKGISLLIQMEIGDYSITEADSCSKVMSELNKNYFTHLILDVIFPDGSSLEILPNIKSLYPAIKILIFSMQPPEIHGEAFKYFNITYYLSKTSDNATVVKVLTNFLNNDKNIAESNMMISGINPFKTLTPRELQILHYMLNGFGTKQISETLNLKMNSVSTLKKRIYQKTESPNFKSLIDLCTLYKINY
ncbi:MAG TPA: response regulator transcription factor [Panacibacter sp.]|nr:response regulator transcription factor [Panacibacter sp.]